MTFNAGQRTKVLDLLWSYLKPAPGDKDRKQTGWGSKTQNGLIACIERIAVEGSAAEVSYTVGGVEFGTEHEAQVYCSAENKLGAEYRVVRVTVFNEVLPRPSRLKK